MIELVLVGRFHCTEYHFFQTALHTQAKDHASTRKVKEGPKDWVEFVVALRDVSSCEAGLAGFPFPRRFPTPGHRLLSDCIPPQSSLSKDKAPAPPQIAISSFFAFFILWCEQTATMDKFAAFGKNIRCAAFA